MLLVNVGTAGAAQSPADTVRLLERVRERLAAMPDVVSVTYTAPSGRSTLRLHASAAPLAATVESVGPDYLETLNLAPTAGRSVSRADILSASGAAMISGNLAATAFPGSNPIGRTLLIGEQRAAVVIIGVTPNIRVGRSNEPTHHVFLAHRPTVSGDGRFERPTTMWVRYTGALDGVSAVVPGALRDVDPRIAIAGQETLDAQLADEAVGARMISRLLMTFAGISLLIAAVGQYAVVAFNMRRRTRDFGVRIALGASASQIVGAVLREGTRLTLAGLAFGLALSVAVATLLRGVLFGVTPTDPPTYLAVFVLLAFVSLLACYLPARRASHINPVQALRQE
jgi:ABC-type antimicrobial peptide transport system permease subunit